MTRLKMVCTCEEDQITNLHGIDVGLNLVYDLQRRAYEGGQLRVRNRDMSILRADSG